MMRRLGAALAAAIVAYAAMADVTGIITPLGGGLPSQTGNSGKFLTTNGSTPSWGTVAGGSSAFNALTSGTNTSAAMLVGTGASLGTTGTGTISASQINGAAIPTSAAVLSSNASNQLVAATTTGSGSNVLATSPTLVTPALGTPSSATLTNATGLPLSTGVTGLLGLTNLDQSIAPTWTSNHTFSSTGPRMLFQVTGAGTDQKLWAYAYVATAMTWSTRTDADAAGQNIFQVTRGTGTAISAETFGNATNNPSYSFLGTGTMTVGGPIAATGLVTPAKGIVSGGTKFTIVGTGCTIATTVGGAATGTFTLATGPCTSAVITINGATGSTAPNGWNCFFADRTAPTVLISQTASTTTTATVSIPAGAGTADVVQFECSGY